MYITVSRELVMVLVILVDFSCFDMDNYTNIYVHIIIIIVCCQNIGRVRLLKTCARDACVLCIVLNATLN